MARRPIGGPGRTLRDASWYLVIAHYGYRPELGAYTSSRTAFFPLYPLGLHAIAFSGVPPSSPACCCPFWRWRWRCTGSIA